MATHSCDYLGKERNITLREERGGRGGGGGEGETEEEEEEEKGEEEGEELMQISWQAEIYLKNKKASLA